ncbi:FimD/PapC N-terminal domain-containing protein [Hafnia alvei]|uniref:FimD/PapC N-terminal domain-containing protein n=1 Tax=Hafnia alvei TaxID=569 RepID=UPI00214C4E6C|nr:FimD/PapC N-terminal domain-containing protein [Hafnia alvei]
MSAVAKRSICRAFDQRDYRRHLLLDVYTNDEWKGRYDLSIARDKDGRLGVCYTKAMLAQYGIAAEKLNPQLSEQEGYCGSLKSWRNEEKRQRQPGPVLPAVEHFGTADL